MPIENFGISSSSSLQAFLTSRMKRGKRLPNKYDPHITQFIRAKLTLPKSKNLDKAHGGKVMAIELLKASIESVDSRD
uniref:Uncharacterized protein n=1 Tax=Cannabis sativa TaxID=3483 RepID=A0A803Q2R0_CANSA